ncbi:MAG: reverse transcriptase domain-containing protein, partial [Sphaerochaeta sp.]|nr:reverse transcriptase domain-containing protein [Sphaerochaeta sp.]
MEHRWRSDGFSQFCLTVLCRGTEALSADVAVVLGIITCSAYGGNLSPILANILLNECDHELELRGHRFVRYADDMVISCASRK